MRRIIRAFSSTRWAFVLMSVTAASCLVGILIPWGKSPASFYGSLPFVLLLGLLSLGLSVFSIKRVGEVRHFLAIRGRPAHTMMRWWGNSIFHWGLCLLALSVMVSFLSRRQWTVDLMEGQVAPLDHLSSISATEGILSSFDPPPFTLHLTHLSESERSAAAEVFILEGSSTPVRRHISPNEPLNYNGYRIYLDPRIGYSTQLVLSGPTGYSIDTYVGFPTASPKSRNDLPENNFVYPDTPFLVYASLDPNTASLPSSPSGDGPSFVPLERPSIHIDLSHASQTLFSGNVPYRDSVRFSGLTMSFTDARYLAVLHIVRDPWITGIIIGLCISLAGMALRIFTLFRTTPLPSTP